MKTIKILSFPWDTGSGCEILECNTPPTKTPLEEIRFLCKSTFLQADSGKFKITIFEISFGYDVVRYEYLTKVSGKYAVASTEALNEVLNSQWLDYPRENAKRFNENVLLRHFILDFSDNGQHCILAPSYNFKVVKEYEA